MKLQIGTTTQAQPRVPDQLVGFRSVNRDMAAFESLGAKDPIEPWWFRDPLAEDFEVATDATVGLGGTGGGAGDGHNFCWR